MDRRSDLLGTRECRTMAVSELRATVKDDNTLVIEGYASVFDTPYEVWDFMETVDPGAFDKTLAASPDVPLLLNHSGLPLARTKSGNLHLSADAHGLKMRAELDLRDPDAQSLRVKMERGDLDEMSFAFYTIRDEWSDDLNERRLIEVNIHKGDVSIVNYGANPATSVGIADAIRTLADAQENELAAIRADLDDLSVVTRAQRTLGAYLRSQRTHMSSVAAARAVVDGLAD